MARSLCLALAALALVAASPAFAKDPVARCAAAQLSAGAKLCLSLFVCRARSVSRPERSTAACIEKARDRFVRSWESAPASAARAESACEVDSSPADAFDAVEGSVAPVVAGILADADLSERAGRRVLAGLLGDAGSLCRSTLKAQAKNAGRPDPGRLADARARALNAFERRAEGRVSALGAKRLAYRGMAIAEIPADLMALPAVLGFSPPDDPGDPMDPASEVRIAFIGDQGIGADARDVLALIAGEGADAVLHQGDFDYRDDPEAWEAQIDDILGPDFPYFASVGNHDESRFYAAGGYQDRLEARLNRLGIGWEGDLGVQSSFHFRGIFVVTTAPDVFGAGDGFHDVFIRDALAADDSVWSISSWHKNMTAMQLGTKSNATGWGVYEESRRGGAVIATGHEHSYSRTHLMASFESQSVASTQEPLVLSADDPATADDEGRSFAFVSGLGGQSIRNQDRDGPWWASVYTSDQGARPAALFGVFNHGGDPLRAFFYLKDVDGNVVDEFTVESTLGPR